MTPFGWRFAFIVSLVLLLFPAAGFSQTGQTSGKILFLTFAMRSDSTIVLKSSSVVPGTLKNRKIDAHADFSYEITRSGSPEKIAGSLFSPLARHTDYPDRDNPKILHSRIVVQKEAEFIVRVPYAADLSDISFYEKAGVSDAVLQKSSAGNTFPKGNLLRTIAIPHRGTK